jgi:fibronectin-binding autotransporter adhesin
LTGGAINVGTNNQSIGALFVSGGTLQGSATVTATSYEVQGGTISAVLGGTGALSKTGAANTTGTLTAANTFSGSTTLSAGTLAVSVLDVGGQPSGIGASSNAAANLNLNGGTLNYVGTTNAVTDRQFSLNSSTTAIAASGVGDATLTWNSSGGFQVNNGNTIYLAGTSTFNNTWNVPISGSSGLGKSGGGRWLLGLANTFTGTLNVAQGTLDIQSFNQNIGVGSFTGGAIIGSGIVTASQRNLVTGGSVAVVLAGSGSLEKLGTGNTGTLSALNTYTGLTQISEGTLVVNTLANGGAASPIGMSSNAPGNLRLNGGTLRYIGAGASTDRLFEVSNGGSINSSGSGPLNFTNTGAILGGGGNLNLAGTFTGSANTLSPQINGGINVFKEDSGNWILANANNNYTGNTQIDGGSLTISTIADAGVPSSIGAPTDPNSQNALTFGGGTLNYTGAGGSTNRSLAVNTTGAILSNGSGPISFTNNNSVGGGGTLLTLGGSNTGANTFAPTINDDRGVTKANSGRWILTGSNTYARTTTVSAGTLEVNAAAGSIILNGSVGSNGGGANITGGRLQFNYVGASPRDQIQTLLVAGYNAGSFNNTTTQIRSTNATSAIGLGMLDDGSSVTVARAYYGDANIDGKVNAIDFNILATNFGASSKHWQDGDYNYDGVVNSSDFSALAQNFNQSLAASPALEPALGALVPEPASLGLLAMLGTTLGARRRRSR